MTSNGNINTICVMMRNGLEVGMTSTCSLVIVIDCCSSGCALVQDPDLHSGIRSYRSNTDITHSIISNQYIMLIGTSDSRDHEIILQALHATNTSTSA